MATSRRSFLQLVGVNGLAVAAGACGPKTAAMQAPAAAPTAPASAPAGGFIRLSANENSNGPGSRVLDAVQQAFGVVNRYPFETAHQLTAAIARAREVSPDQVVLGCGSSEILDAAVLAFAEKDRGIVTALPTFELVGDVGKHMGVPVAEVPVTLVK